MEVYAQQRALHDLGVTFALGRLNDAGDPEIRIAGSPFGMLQEATQFRDEYEVELRCVLMANDDTRWLMSLDFLRWRVDSEEFGPLPGLRQIFYPVRDDEEDAA